ncbi:MAG: AAA family ATPase [Solirubrobacteraceae bacterium]|nr:AAA family ATPase [Solirubrobacteraceae bacterium]
MSVEVTERALVGRTSELGQISEFVAQARGGHGASVLITGEPGAGKTALVQATSRMASGFDVLRCRGVESEITLPYSGLHTLLKPLVTNLDQLTADQRGALSAALALKGPGAASPIDVAMGVLTLLANAARPAPLLVLLDDAHWIDAASLAALSFAARRLDHDPVFMLATARPAEHPPLKESVQIQLGGLSATATRQLAECRLGRPLLDSAADALAHATGGNPLAILEVVQSAAGDIERLGSMLDEPLPTNELIGRAFAARIASLEADVRQAALVVAVAFDDSAELIHRALRHLGLDPSTLDVAEQADVLVQRPGSVAFRHPLLRATAFHSATAVDQREAHRALAVATTNSGARAWHAAGACTEENEEVAAALDAGASEFETRGGHLAAARALERAGRLTPDPERRALRLYRAGVNARHAARSSWAQELLDDANALGPETSLRLRIEYQRILLAGYTGALEGMTERQVRLATEAEAFDKALAAEVWSETVNEFILEGQMERALAAADHLEAFLGDPNDPLAFSSVATTRLLAGVEPLKAADDVRRAAAYWLENPGVGSINTSEALAWLGDMELSAAVCESNLRAARERGRVQTEMVGLTGDGYRRFLMGDWSGALLSNERSTELGIASGQIWQVCAAKAFAALVHGARGEAVTRDVAAAAEEIAETYGYENVVPYLASALGSLELGLGRAEYALPHLERARDWCEQAGYREPALFSWPVDIVDAYIALGRRDDATAALLELEANATACDRTTVLAGVDRLKGLLATDAAFEDHFTRAFARLAGATAPFEQARAHLHFGMRLRRAGQRSRATIELERARDAFGRLGARGWLAQTQSELRALGAPARATDASECPVELTAQENAVADLVAQGMTNKAVAAQLFLTPKTIEWHLRQIYRKLGIKSRTQLAAWMHHTTA